MAALKQSAVGLHFRNMAVIDRTCGTVQVFLMTQRLGAEQDGNGVHSPEGGVRAAARSTAGAQSAAQSLGQRSHSSELRRMQVADVQESLRMLGLTVADVGAVRLPPASVSE